MAMKVKDGYKCGYCYKFFTNPVDADNCKEAHNLIYIAISQEDLNRLINFIYTKEDNLLNPTLVDRLQSYMKNSFKLELSKEKSDGSQSKM